MLRKILTEDTAGKWVDDLPDTPELGTDGMQQAFDYIAKEVIIPIFNSLVEALSSREGAGEIGLSAPGLTEQNVADALARLKALCDDRYTKNESDALLAGGTHGLVEEVGLDLKSGLLTVTKKDGSQKSWDTALEKVPASFEIIREEGIFYLKIVNQDGSSSRVDLKRVMDIYSFQDSAEISFTQTGEENLRTVTACLRPASIGIEKLSLTAVGRLEGYVSGAEASAAAAKAAADAAKTAEAGAGNEKTKAAQSAAAAAGSETAAGESAAQAAESARQAGVYCAAAKSDAAAAGSDADRAQAAADRAEVIAGGDFATPQDLRESAAQTLLSANAYTDGHAAPLSHTHTPTETGADPAGTGAAAQAAAEKAAEAALAAHAQDGKIHVTPERQAAWDGKAETALSSPEAPGLMSAQDKQKLDSIEAGATQGSKNALEFGETDGEAGRWDRLSAAPTAAEPIRYNGYLRATRVYGMYYSDSADYAEAYPVKGEYRPGELIAITGEGLCRNTTPKNTRLLGFVSDSFACCIGCEGENKVPIALCGRVRALCAGRVRPGDFLIASALPGAVESGYLPGGVAAQALEGKEEQAPDRVLCRVLRL